MKDYGSNFPLAEASGGSFEVCLECGNSRVHSEFGIGKWSFAFRTWNGKFVGTRNPELELTLPVTPADVRPRGF